MRSFLQFRHVAISLMTISAALTLSDQVIAQTVTLDSVPAIALTSSAVVSAVSINPSTGNVIVKSSAGNYTSCAQAPGPTINNFSPTLTTVQPGASITLNWSSSNTTSCTPSLGSGTTWASFGTLPSSGSQSFTAPASVGNVTFQLTCTNGAANVSQTTQVTVTTGGGGGSCVAAYPNGQQATYAGVFNSWPAFGVRKRIFVPFNGYVSYSFTATSTIGQFGSFATSDFPGDGDGHGLMSISTTPGCFDQSKLGVNCLSPVSRFVSIGWANGSTQFSCSLTPGTQYYLNWTYGSSTVQGSAPHCPVGPGQSCGADVQNQIQD